MSAPAHLKCLGRQRGQTDTERILSSGQQDDPTRPEFGTILEIIQTEVGVEVRVSVSHL